MALAIAIAIATGIVGAVSEVPSGGAQTWAVSRGESASGLSGCDDGDGDGDGGDGSSGPQHRPLQRAATRDAAGSTAQRRRGTTTRQPISMIAAAILPPARIGPEMPAGGDRRGRTCRERV